MIPQQRSEELVARDEALERLKEADPRAARVVECRVFCGLSADETADALGITRRTVSRDWSAARAWLYGELRQDLTAVTPCVPPPPLDPQRPGVTGSGRQAPEARTGVPGGAGRSCALANSEGRRVGKKGVGKNE